MGSHYFQTLKGNSFRRPPTVCLLLANISLPANCRLFVVFVLGADALSEKSLRATVD